jgi:hypothetical protein
LAQLIIVVKMGKKEKNNKQKQIPKKGKKQQPKKKQVKKKTGLSLTHGKVEDFSGWYSEVITKAELIEYYDVSGYVIVYRFLFI